MSLSAANNDILNKGVIIRPPTDVENKYSVGGVSTPAITYTSAFKPVLSGLLTAGVYKSVLDVSGSGIVKGLAMLQADTTSRDISCRVTVDGVIKFEATSSVSLSIANAGLLIWGDILFTGGTDYSLIASAMEAFTKSLKVEVKSTTTETDKVNLYIVY